MLCLESYLQSVLALVNIDRIEVLHQQYLIVYFSSHFSHSKPLYQSSRTFRSLVKSVDSQEGYSLNSHHSDPSYSPRSNHQSFPTTKREPQISLPPYPLSY